jgi:hypothetical protein
MCASFNIVELIENNPITSITDTYQNKLLTKIKSNFTDDEQQIFVASFYTFLNHDSRTDFVIDLDNVWKWIGFSNKAHSKRLLEKQFIINKDYKVRVIFADEKNKHVKGGHNREIIMLNIETFEKFCLKAGTTKADEIHDYYIRLQQTLLEVIHEESTELKLQLEQKNVELQHSENTKEKIREKTLLEQFANNTQCVYYGLIDNVGDKNEKLIKFGNSNNLKNRVVSHKGTYNNFRLLNAFKVTNKLQIENAIKEDVLFIERQRTITIKQKKYIEILNADGLLLTTLDKTIKDIIVSIECTPENYRKIIEENKLLKKQLVEKHDNIPKEEQPVFVKPHAFTRNKEGGYTVAGNIYETLTGSRENVFNGKSFKTTGGLTKSDLIINKYGKILSKKKSIDGKISKNFEQINLARMKMSTTQKEQEV